MPPTATASKKPLILRIMGLGQAAVHIEPGDNDDKINIDDTIMMQMMMSMIGQAAVHNEVGDNCGANKGHVYFMMISLSSPNWPMSNKALFFLIPASLTIRVWVKQSEQLSSMQWNMAAESVSGKMRGYKKATMLAKLSTSLPLITKLTTGALEVATHIRRKIPNNLRPWCWMQVHVQGIICTAGTR